MTSRSRSSRSDSRRSDDSNHPDSSPSQEHQEQSTQPTAGQTDGAELGATAKASEPEAIDEVNAADLEDLNISDLPMDRAIIDVRAIPVEGTGASHTGGSASRDRTHRGREMFPDVSEVPPEYSGLFQDYDSAPALGTGPVWLDEAEGEAEPQLRLPTLMIGGVVLATFASGMGLAQLHNMQRQNAAKAEPKAPANAPANAKVAADPNAAQASQKTGAKSAPLAKPEALNPTWLTPAGTKGKSAPLSAKAPATATSFPAVPKPAVTIVAPATNLMSSPPALPLPNQTKPSLASLKPLTAGISPRPLSRTMMMTPQIFPARLSMANLSRANLSMPKSSPAIVPATRPVIRPARIASSGSIARASSPDRFSSMTASAAASRSAEPMQLRSIDEIMAERMGQSAANLSRRNQSASSQPGAQVILSANPKSGTDRNGRPFGYESLNATAPSRSARTAPLPDRFDQPGTETAQWQATSQVITTAAGSAATIANPGMPSISLPALSISVQDSLTEGSVINLPTNDPAALSKEGLPLPPVPKASAPETEPQASLSRSMDLASAQVEAGPISSPEYSGIEYSAAD
jgi:hypothetical protein